jgi:hypothetical protein
LNSKGAGKEKRARRVVTRPKPTIYGNCDSWSFIVGKKPRAYRRDSCQKGALQTSNRNVIHNLSTKIGGNRWDNLWAICGSGVDPAQTSRMVVPGRGNMPQMPDRRARFYPKSQLAF